MNFAIYVRAFEHEDRAWMPLDDMRARFVDGAIGEEPGMLFPQFSAPAMPAMESGFEVDERVMIDGFPAPPARKITR